MRVGHGSKREKPLTPREVSSDVNTIFMDGSEQRIGGTTEVLDPIAVDESLF